MKGKTVESVIRAHFAGTTDSELLAKWGEINIARKAVELELERRGILKIWRLPTRRRRRKKT